MSQLIGDTSYLNEEQKTFIAKAVEKIGLFGAKVTIEAVGQPGDNYIAAVKRIKAEKDGKAVHIIAKVASPIPKARAAVDLGSMFYNEIVMYSEILPKFSELESSLNLPEREKFRYAKCYGCLAKEPLEIILLEDLSVAGYTLLDKLQPLTDVQMKEVMTNFAKYHSFSYVLKHKDPATFSKLKSKLRDNWMHMLNDKRFVMMCEGLEVDVMNLFKHDQRYRRILVDSVGKVPAYMKESAENDSDSKYAVISHADGWTNNFMFSAATKECCIIDYQLARMNVPAADLHFVILNSSDYDTRSKYYTNWINHYHAELAKNVGYFDLDINVVYPRTQLEIDLKRYAKMFVGYTIWMSCLALRDVESARKVKEAMDSGEGVEDFQATSGIKGMKPEYVALHRKRIKGMIDSHVELGYYHHESRLGKELQAAGVGTPWYGAAVVAGLALISAILPLQRR